MDEVDAYLRALKDLAGLGQSVATTRNVSRKSFRSANIADFFALGELSRAGLITAELPTPDQNNQKASAAVEPASSRPNAAMCKKRRPSRHPKNAEAGGARERLQAISQIQLPDASEPKRAFTVAEAVKLYSISRSSLYNLVKAGALPDIVVAGRRRFRATPWKRLLRAIAHEASVSESRQQTEREYT